MATRCPQQPVFVSRGPAHIGFLLVLAVAAASLAEAAAAAPPRRPQLALRAAVVVYRPKVASLLKKRWNWQSAADETKTEWAIVLRRYTEVDMELASLVFSISNLMASGDGDDATGRLPALRRKAGKISVHLRDAVQASKVSDDTLHDMDKEKRLTTEQRQSLEREHTLQKQQTLELATLGQAAWHAADALLTSFSQQRAGQNSTQLAVGTTNSSSGGSSSTGLPTEAGLTALRAAVKAYQERREGCEQRARSAVLRLAAFASHVGH
mmetsp:Transcript_52259/g.149751  ORF Transcript_52259/g.149751 Transcript_52259/m.149751 type:complete len:267 (-) Transcript_52259:86-886(-)